MKRKIYILLLIILTCSCGKYKSGPGDMKYRIHKDSSGTTIKTGDFLSVHFIHKTEEDSLIASSYDTGTRTYLEQQNHFFKGDIFDGLAMLSAGDSATFKLNFDSMQTAFNVMKPDNTRGKYLLFTVKIEKVISRKGLTEDEFKNRVEELMLADALEAKKAEPHKIEAFIKQHDIKAASTRSGLRLQISKRSQKRRPQKGDTVLFNCTGMYLSGKIFSSSRLNQSKTTFIPGQRTPEPMEAIAGEKSTIPGIDEALMVLADEEEATIIVPSHLAHGDRGNSIFGPYTPLAFNLEILEIKRK